MMIPPVQIAPLAAVDQTLAAFVDAMANQDPRMAPVCFDVSGTAGLR
jgi:hypothetical protein